MKQRFYFDTSVFGGMFDSEFEEETSVLFEKVNLGQIVCLFRFDRERVIKGTD